MKRLLSAAAGAIALLAATGASAAVVANFQLNGSLANAAAGPVTLTNNGAALSATGITFAANQGPTLLNLGSITEYALEIGGTFDQTGGYRKIADFFDRASDTGFYDLSGFLNFYPVATGPTPPIVAGTPFVVKLTRDSSKLVTGYVNGVSQFHFTDTGNLAVIDSKLHLFRDDFATSQSEASSGFIDFVTLNANPIAGVPEPASWALMISGFGAAGAMLRRRRAVAVA